MNNDVRTLNYRWFSKSFWKYLRAFFFFALLVIISDIVTELGHGERFRPEDLGILIIMSACIYFMHRQTNIADSVLHVYQDRITIFQHGKEQIYYFKNVTGVGLSKFGPTQLMLKLDNATTVSVTTGFERREYILEALHDSNPSVLSDEDFHRYRNKLIKADHNLARFYSGPSNILYAFISIGLFAGALILTYLKQKNYIVIHSPPQYLIKYMRMGLVAWAMLHLTGIKFFNNKINKKFALQFLKDASNKTRDIKFENHLIKSIRVVQFSTALIILSAVYGTDLNLYDLTWIDKQEIDSQKLNSGLHLYDMKFNCLKCKYPLKKLDIIILNDHTVAQILALPGEEISLRELSSGKSRKIASELIQVPPANIAVGLFDGELIELIEEAQVIGKIIR